MLRMVSISRSSVSGAGCAAAACSSADTPSGMSPPGTKGLGLRRVDVRVSQRPLRPLPGRSVGPTSCMPSCMNEAGSTAPTRLTQALVQLNVSLHHLH